MTDKNNSLIRIAPELVEEWHTTKNGEHSPSTVTASSKKNGAIVQLILDLI
ncbi:zinc-ribbon domain-containing protein [Cytobacillus kochii]